MKVKIRKEQPSDFKAIRMLNINAFNHDNEARLIDHLRSEKEYLANLLVFSNFYPKFGWKIANSYGIFCPNQGVFDEAVHEVSKEALKGITGTVTYSKAF